ncbi:MAG TPA: GspE/PulE family protein [Roseimicrobium sp.]|nr:GspE/PulE family protein [Roseimicrobium sp.]
MSHTNRYLQSDTAARGIEIGTLVNYVLLDCIQAGASDIHIEPWESTIVVRVRVSGVLSELVHLPLDLAEKIAGRFKVMSDMNISKTGIPQEGHASTPPEMGGVELRISIFPTVRGEKIVVRIFDPSSRSFDLKALGFEEQTLDVYLKLLTKPSGLILLTGPTGSGKTTAIYASLYYLVKKRGSSISISTVEDPVEYPLSMVSQAQINNAQEFTYPVALRSLMRQNPEVIMIGEIRDPETAAIAVQAGLTGHLVISTIHSGTTAGVFARLINMEIEPFLLSSSVLGVLGVRLLRHNCQYCAAPYEPEEGLIRLLPPEVLDEAQFRRGMGCDHCGQTGYIGRKAIAELLTPSDAFRDAVMQKMPSRALQKIAAENGMQTLWQIGMHRAISGQSPLEEVARVVASDQL